MTKWTWLSLVAIIVWNVTSTLNAGKGWGAVPGAVFLVLVIFGVITLLKGKGSRISPFVRNETTKLQAKTRHRAFWVGIVATILLVGIDSSVVHLVVVVTSVLYAAYAVPALAVLVVIGAAMTMGGDLILVAAPITVILARRDRWMRLDIPRSLMHAMITSVTALLAFVFSLASASMTMGGNPASGTAAQSPSDEGLIAALLRALGVDTNGRGAAEPSRPIRVPSSPPEPPQDRSVPWLWLLAIGLIAAMIAAVVIWRRRRKARTPSLISARPLARLEAIGESIGRPRQSNEGALSYAAALNDRSGDQRLPETGDLVSGRLYASASTDPASVDARLGQLEHTPPVVPKVPWSDRIRQGAQWPIDHWRGVGLTIGGTGALALAIFSIAPQVNSFSDAPDLLAFDRDAALFQNAESTPDEWFDLFDRDPSQVTQWESCSSGTATPLESIRRRASGLATLDGSLAMQVQGYGSEPQVSVTVGTPEAYWRLLDPATRLVSDPNDARWQHADWGVVPQNPFPSLDRLLIQIPTEDPLVSVEVDRFGHRYQRFESQPLTYAPDDESSYEPTPFIGSSHEYSWTLDVWVDELDVPTRARVMVNDPDKTWLEWRRLSTPAGNVLDGPTCPTLTADQSPPVGDDWVGPEAWEPRRPAPVRVASTAGGFLFESDPWYDDGDKAETDTIGSIPGPLTRIGLDDYLPLYGAELLGEDADPVATRGDRVVALVDWPEGASLSLVNFSYGPEATRLDRADAGEGNVVEWGEPQPFEVWESFVTITTESGLGTMETDAISELLGPLWDGDDLVSTDRSGDGLDDTYLVTQSWVESVMYGYDDRGDLVSIVLVGETGRWRTLGYEGEPPASITAREAELQACLDGDHPVDAAGYCQ